jgi:Putative transmembrane protein (PGPGW).
VQTPTLERTVRTAKTVMGFALLGAGIAMLALPGPGWLMIIAGLAMLAGEFQWARRLLDQVKDAANRVRPHAKP